MPGRSYARPGQVARAWTWAEGARPDSENRVTMEPVSLLKDVVFKIVFAAESRRPVLRALLNAL